MMIHNDHDTAPRMDEDDVMNIGSGDNDGDVR
jgi:hypothetical protein